MTFHAQTNAVTIGLDFGTGSARAVLIDLDTGGAVAEHVAGYPKGFIDGSAATEMGLVSQSVVQDPADFVHATEELLTWAARESDRRRLTIQTIGITATSCTVLPTLGNGTPLLHIPTFRERPHAYAKLWKHHAADAYAQRINAAQPEFLRRYDGRTSSEWSLAKGWQTMVDDRELWHAAERWIDLADWIVWQLTGEEMRSASQAGCKNHWQPDQGGYPDARTLEAISPELSSWLDKLAPPHPIGTIVGSLTPAWQQTTGIASTVRVAVAIVDAEAAVPGSDVNTPGILVAAIGTSTCHLSLSRSAIPVPGIESTTYSAAVPGLYDYCTGQAATGDMFAWLARLLTHHGKATAAEVFDSLTAALEDDDGPSPVTVMDWWNGCRTPLGRADLSGVIRNLTMTTTSADIYRAMLEAAAMGMRYARDLHHRVEPIEEIRITGGMARFPPIMQLYADVLGQNVKANPTVLGTARGAAIVAANGAGWPVPPNDGYRDYEARDSHRYGERYREYVEDIEHASSPQ